MCVLGCRPELPSMRPLSNTCIMIFPVPLMRARSLPRVYCRARTHTRVDQHVPPVPPNVTDGLEEAVDFYTVGRYKTAQETVPCTLSASSCQNLRVNMPSFAMNTSVASDLIKPSFLEDLTDLIAKTLGKPKKVRFEL